MAITQQEKSVFVHIPPRRPPLVVLALILTLILTLTLTTALNRTPIVLTGHSE